MYVWSCCTLLWTDTKYSQYKTICRSCYVFFLHLLFFFSFYVWSCCTLLQTDTKYFLYKTICRTRYVFFSSLSDFFSRFSLVAVCHRRIHQNFYIKPFVALVTLFSLPFLIFFFKTLSCCSLLRTDTKYCQYKTFVALVTFLFSPLSDFFSRFCLVAVCHRRIHQNLYIKPFVALVTFFSLPFLIFIQDFVLLQFVTEAYTKISL